MAINFEKALGIHEGAVALRSQRTAILTNNLANADTPGYLARDIDFRTLLSEMAQDKAHNDYAVQSGVKLLGSHTKHLETDIFSSEDSLKYRVPLSPSQDGNTVEPSLEYVKFTENAIRYEASLQFLSGKFKGMINALKGGNQ